MFRLRAWRAAEDFLSIIIYATCTLITYNHRELYEVKFSLVGLAITRLSPHLYDSLALTLY